MNTSSVKKVLHNIKSWIQKIKPSHIKNGLIIVFIFIIIGNAFYITLIYLDREYDFNILNRTYISAIYPNQDINDTLYTDIVIIQALDNASIQPGNQIVTYGEYGTNEYWVMNVIDINENTDVIEYTYDNTISYTKDSEDVIGIYDRDANVLGTVYYGAVYIRGYILLTVSHLFIISMIFFAFYDKENSKA